MNKAQVKNLKEKEQLEKFFNTEIGKKSASLLANKKNIRKFAPQWCNGALAHLARALDWQSKGDEFESRMLHIS